MSKTAPQTAPLVQSQTAVAACSAMAINSATTEIQLTPTGVFRGIDGRPTNAPHWYIDADVAASVIAAASARVNRYVIDYDHQTLRAATNGQPAPAAGWFSGLEWREGEGLFGVGVEWTAAAQAMIDAGEYRYISPVISYDKATGNVNGLLMAALTNYAAIDGMDEATLAAACAQLTLTHTATAALTQELSNMEPLLEQLRWLLNLPVASTAEDILANLNRLAEMIKTTTGADGVAAASCDLIALITEQGSSIASLSAAMPDPAKFVPIAAFEALQQSYASLSATSATANLDEVISTALAENKLMPGLEGWAREWGGRDIAALSAWLEKVPVVAALVSPQSKTIEIPKTADQLTDGQAALCAVMGCDPADFVKNLKV